MNKKTQYPSPQPTQKKTVVQQASGIIPPQAWDKFDKEHISDTIQMHKEINLAKENNITKQLENETLIIKNNSKIIHNSRWSKTTLIIVTLSVIVFAFYKPSITKDDYIILGVILGLYNKENILSVIKSFISLFKKTKR